MTIHIIYNEASISFRLRCMRVLKEIFKKETDLEFQRNRFKYKNYSYPLHLVVFESTNKLGYFDSSLMEIGISKSLMFDEKTTISVLRHEIAHLICFLEYGDQVAMHGAEFKSICKRFGWEEEVRAKLDTSEIEKKNKRIHDKVRKLLELAKSGNVHEATSALSKARDLMITHQIDELNEEDGFVIVRVIEAKRVSEKMRSIATILRSFCVYPVMNHGKGKVYLEVFGRKDNVEVAEYIAHMLDHKLEALWNEQQELKGLRSKNSFFQGVAKGFTDKSSEKAAQKAVMKIENQLCKEAAIAYPHLRSSSSRKSIDLNALKKGKSAGENMKLPKGVKKKKGLHLLPLHN